MIPGYVAKCPKNLSASQVANYRSERHLKRFHGQNSSTVRHEFDKSTPLRASEKFGRKHRRGWKSASQNEAHSDHYRLWERGCRGNFVIQQSVFFNALFKNQNCTREETLKDFSNDHGIKRISRDWVLDCVLNFTTLDKDTYILSNEWVEPRCQPSTALVPEFQ